MADKFLDKVDEFCSATLVILYVVSVVYCFVAVALLPFGIKLGM